MLRYRTTGTLYVTWTAGHGNFRFDVYGTEGSATVDLVKSQALELHLTPRDDGADGCHLVFYSMDHVY